MLTPAGRRLGSTSPSSSTDGETNGLLAYASHGVLAAPSPRAQLNASLPRSQEKPEEKNHAGEGLRSWPLCCDCNKRRSRTCFPYHGPGSWGRKRQPAAEDTRGLSPSPEATANPGLPQLLLWSFEGHVSTGAEGVIPAHADALTRALLACYQEEPQV